MREQQHCQSKLVKVFEERRLFNKNKARASLTQQAYELAFISKLEYLLDIAHADELAMSSVLQ